MRKSVLVGLLIVLTVIGCKKSEPNIVGTWTSGLGGALTTYHFRADGSFSLESMYDGMVSRVSGKYHIKDSMLYLDPVETDLQGSGPKADYFRGTLSQSSRVAILDYHGSIFQLGRQMPPLMVTRVSQDP